MFEMPVRPIDRAIPSASPSLYDAVVLLYRATAASLADLCSSSRSCCEMNLCLTTKTLPHPGGKSCCAIRIGGCRSPSFLQAWLYSSGFA